MKDAQVIRDAERRTRISVHLGTEWPSPGAVVFIDVEEKGGDIDEHITVGPKVVRRLAKALLKAADKMEAP